MKAILTSCVALSLLTGLAAEVNAKPYKKKYGYSSNHGAKSYGPRYRPYPPAMYSDNYAGYYEHRLDSVPFGSRLWWRVWEEQLPRN